MRTQRCVVALRGVTTGGNVCSCLQRWRVWVSPSSLQTGRYNTVVWLQMCCQIWSICRVPQTHTYGLYKIDFYCFSIRFHFVQCYWYISVSNKHIEFDLLKHSLYLISKLILDYRKSYLEESVHVLFRFKKYVQRESKKTYNYPLFGYNLIIISILLPTWRGLYKLVFRRPNTSFTNKSFFVFPINACG